MEERLAYVDVEVCASKLNDFEVTKENHCEEHCGDQVLLDDISNESLHCGFVEAVPLLQHKCLEVAEWDVDQLIEYRLDDQES